MKRVLVFGDTHIPARRDSIPESFDRRIRSGKYDLALVTGDLVKEKAMRNVMPPLPECHIVQGNMDLESRRNHHEELTIEELRFLLIHGTQLSPRGNIDQLSEIASKVEADVSIHGHTHEPSVELFQGRLFLNPGTISGATGGWGGRKDASFMEMEVAGTQLVVSLFLSDWSSEMESRTRYSKIQGQMIAL